MAQPETGGVRKTEGEDSADIRNVNIRDEQSENTQREDWLLPTEPSYGARPPDTPIRDVMDRCRSWESHADPAISRTRKPTPDPMSPTFTIGETDSNNKITKVAAVTELKFGKLKFGCGHRTEIRCTLPNTERPNPTPEIPDILERLQQLLRESVPNTLEQTLKPLFDGQRQPPRLRQQR